MLEQQGIRHGHSQSADHPDLAAHDCLQNSTGSLLHLSQAVIPEQELEESPLKPRKDIPIAQDQSLQDHRNSIIGVDDYRASCSPRSCNPSNLVDPDKAASPTSSPPGHLQLPSSSPSLSLHSSSLPSSNQPSTSCLSKLQPPVQLAQLQSHKEQPQDELGASSSGHQSPGRAALQSQIEEVPESDSEVDGNGGHGLRRWRITKHITLNNKAKYLGELLGGKKDGHGEQVWQDGSRYEGQWANDQANGYGKMVHADGNVYEGNWLNDMAHGFGTFTHARGGTYRGQWQQNLRHGQGEETWPDGSKYTGCYQNGKKHGEGALLFADGSKYSGNFQNNEMSGFGKYCWPDGKVYEGEWKHNKMRGQGVLIFSDGKRYEGEFNQ